jgi:hypothetical protein
VQVRTKRVGIAMAIAAGVLATIVGVGRAASDDATATAQPWTRSATALAVTSQASGSATAGDAALAPSVPTPAVMAALESRTIRALDNLFVAVPTAPALRRGAAATHCRNLVVAGLANWRLPSANEIAVLGDAGFVPADSTWWIGGKKVRKPRVEWTGKRTRSQSAKKTSAARAVCVHAVQL